MPGLKTIVFLLFIFFSLSAFCEDWTVSVFQPDSSLIREVIIEDFDDGEVSLQSYPGEDQNPSAWELSSGITYGNSPYSLKLTGNTWKMQNIQPVTVDSGDVWQVSAYIQSVAEIQGFGIMDSAHVMFYSFTGTEGLSGDEWIPVYQGCFPNQQWNVFQLPIAEDWLATYGYLPKITKVVYVNDRDATSIGIAYFDFIIDMTDDLPVAPQVLVSYTSTNKNRKSIEVSFTSEVIDPDSDNFEYFWDFGDGTLSSDPNPTHTFIVTDDHPYTVFLKVSDDTEKWGFASCRIAIGQGSSSFPITLNFVGDIMLARGYEQSGGIIPTQGVEAIFEPTLPWLGDAADISVANLECPLTDYWIHHPTKSIYFKGSPENVDGLTYAGIDLVSLANNHVFDYLQPGMQETQDVLRTHNILFSGSGDNLYEAFLPAFISKSGVNFAFLATCDRTGQYNNYQPYLNAGYNKPGFANMTEYNISNQIAEVRSVADLVVMEYHSGVEYSFGPANYNMNENPFAGDIEADEDYNPMDNEPDDWNREIRHLAIDQGADLVICHHPHIIHGVELYNGKLIAHSLGNFAFDLSYPETFHSMILNAKANQSGFYEFTITPVYIDDFIPGRAQGELGLYILDDLARRSKDLDTYLWVERDSVIAKVVMDTVNMITRDVETSVNLNLDFSNGTWQTPPYRLQRTGSFSSVSTIDPPAGYQYRLGRESVWFGNMEDEGSSMWYLNNSSETYCDTVAFIGDRSIQHKRDENSAYNLVTNLEKKILLISDTLEYSLCGYIKTLNASNVTLEIQYFEDRDDEEPIGEENIGAGIDGTTPWTFYHHQLTIPAGTQFIDIRLNSGIPNSGTAYSWFDNVSLVCWDKWIEYELQSKVPTPNDYYFLQIKSNQNQGEISISYSETVFEGEYVNVENRTVTPFLKSQLDQNFPNPFNPELGTTSISFLMIEQGNIKISVFDFMGREVKLLTKGRYEAGLQRTYWDGRNFQGDLVGSGVYFYQFEFQDQKFVKKCIVIRN